MKAIGLLLLVLIVWGCNRVRSEDKDQQNKDSIKLKRALLPEWEKRRILEDSIINGELVTNWQAYKDFYKDYYPNDSIACKNYPNATDYYVAFEPLINPNKLQFKNKWFRMYLYPCFYNPFLLKVERQKNNYLVTYKLLDIKSQLPSKILLEYTYIPNDTIQFHSLFQYLDSTNFIANDLTYPKCKLSDGNHWTFEYINGNKYNKIQRADPEIDYCGSRSDYGLAIKCLNIIKKSPVNSILKSNFGNIIHSPYAYLQMYPEKVPAKE